MTGHESLHEKLHRHGQGHVLAFWDRIDEASRSRLLEQVSRIDFAGLAGLYQQRGKASAVPPPEAIEPVPVIPHNAPDNPERSRRGEAALARGEVAVLLVAGGQGSRLGFEKPKGMYPVGPLSRKSLFQLHAEKVLALRRRHGAAVPFLIMTSPATHDETVEFFDRHRHFGLPREDVAFFQQGSMPALDLESGRLLLESPSSLFLSPDGHGGTLTALASSGLLARIKDQGVRHVFYFQVDNPMVKVADPVFLGHHLAADAEASSKIVAKRNASERAGVFACVEGRCTIIEYSDLPRELATATTPEGRLRLWAASPAIHLFDVGFLERMTGEADGIPFHVAKKKVPHIDEHGRRVDPETENALKFERFIFDVLPRADRWTVVETLRQEEFAPLKNADGEDSPETVYAALVDQAARWLRRAGAEVRPGVPVEISPLFALAPDHVAEKLPPGTRVEEPRHFE